MVAFAVVVALLAALGWAASRWGADSREPGEWRLPHRPPYRTVVHLARPHHPRRA